MSAPLFKSSDKGGLSDERRNEEESPSKEKIEDELDQLNRMISEQWAQDHPGTESPMFHLFGTEDLPPSQINERPTRRPLTKPFDDLYPYRKSTKWPPITHNTYTTSPLPTDDWLTDYKKNLDKTVENFERNTHIQEQRINYYNTDFAKQLKNIEFKPDFDITPPTLPPDQTRHHLKIFGGGVLALFMLCLIIAARRWRWWYDRTRPVLAIIGVVVPPGAVQQQPQTEGRPPGQGEAVPPYIERPPPYTEGNDMNINEEPPAYSTDTERLIKKNGRDDIGVTNKCGAVTTSRTDPGNVKTVQSTRRADNRDRVLFVDEKSMSNQNY